MKMELIINDCYDLAKAEIKKYGLPTTVHFNLSLLKAIELSEKIGANTDLVKIGTTLMDLKLGQAFKENRLKDHVRMSSEAAKEYLKDRLNEIQFNIVVNCIEAHHGKIDFQTIEAEICANADCYRFIHPLGVVTYLGTLGKRELPTLEFINQAENKLDEKWNILTLKEAKDELSVFYKNLKQLFSEAKSIYKNIQV